MVELILVVLAWVAGGAIALALALFVAGFLAYWAFVVAAAGWALAHVIFHKGDV